MRTLLLLFLPLAALHSANVVYNMQMDTSGLTQGGMYFLDFQFVGDAGNTVTVMNPSYGGGFGDTQTLVMDTISQFFNEQDWQFFAGAFAGFTVNMTNIPPQAGGFPDEFSVFLLDQNGDPLPTSDPGGSSATLDLTGGQPDIQTFPGSGAGAPAVTAAPEPDGFALTLLGLVACGAANLGCSRRFRRLRGGC
jgi:hypothetical protein